MSYLALARKWRPKHFKDIVGQEHVVQALSNALNSKKMHHAYLFSGTRGIGKTTIARILAKAFNCQEGMSADTCGECGNCCSVDEGRFVDLIEVDGASKTKVDDTRELLDNVQYAPSMSDYKIYIIDEVHMLSTHSFNALLKTLEEPPPHVRFFLATTDPEKLPITVLSRCLQFNLKRISPKLIMERLKFICDEEQIKYEDKALAKIARAADGSLRDALSLLDQAIAFSGEELTEVSISDMLGSIDRRYVDQLMQALILGDSGLLIDTIEEIDQYFPNYDNLLVDIAAIFQQLAVVKMTGVIRNNIYQEHDLSDYKESFDPEEIQLNYQISIMGRRDLDLAPSHKIGFEMCLLRMIAFKPDLDLQRNTQVTKKEHNIERNERSKETAKNVNKDEGAREKESSNKNLDNAIWSDLVTELELKGTSRMLADNCTLIKRENNKFFLMLDEKSQSYNNKERQSALSGALSAYYDERIDVDISVGESKIETPNQEKIRREDEILKKAKEDLEVDPGIRDIKDIFSGASFDSDSVKLKK